jgi:hypothetical protein
MDERIALFAEQSEIWNTDGDSDKCEVDLKVFADLIVKECIDILMHDTDRHRKEYFAGLLKEHFKIK